MTENISKREFSPPIGLRGSDTLIETSAWPALFFVNLSPPLAVGSMRQLSFGGRLARIMVTPAAPIYTSVRLVNFASFSVSHASGR